MIKSLRNRKYTLSIWNMTDMAAAGPEFFSPVPELLREWCFLERYVDVCGIIMLVSMSYSSLNVSSGPLGFVCALGEFQLRLRGASCTVDTGLSWKVVSYNDLRLFLEKE